MKVLLINPPIKNIISLEMPLFIRQNEGLFPPLGLMYIASYLKKHVDCDVRILDTLAERMDYEAIEEYVRNFKPDIVGITAHTHNLIDVILVVNIIKKIDKKIHVCLGGAHANIFAKESIEIAGVDSVVLGDGEKTFASLIKSIGEGPDLRKVKGVIFKQGTEHISTGSGEDIEDLDTLPFPDRTLLNNNKYYSILGRKSKMTTMISSRGCPYRCTFCSTPKGFYRMRSSANVADEIEACVELGIDEIHFVDDTFNVNIDRAINICNEIKKRRFKIRWSFRARIDKITEDLIRSAKESGCDRIHLGVETSTDEGLKKLKKDVTLEQIRCVFKWTRYLGIKTVAYFLIGCPDERRREDVLRTISFSKEIDPDFALYNILTPYPSTEIYEEILSKGGSATDCWKEFASNPKVDFKPKLCEESLPREELVSLLNLAYREFYLRPRFLFRIMAVPQNLSTFTRRLKAALRIIRLPF